MGVLGHFEHHFGYLGELCCLILGLLGSFLASFWLSWAVLGRLFGPSWPKLAQVGPRWLEKVDFLSLSCGGGHRVGSDKPEKSRSKPKFFSDAFLMSIFNQSFIDFGLRNSRFWGKIFQGFLDLK